MIPVKTTEAIVTDVNPPINIGLNSSLNNASFSLSFVAIERLTSSQSK